MISLFHVLNLFSAVSFFGFGIACLATGAMRAEFERYGLDRFRKLTGWLQLAGATGLIVGIFTPWIGAAAAAGLCLQMLAGVIVRIRINDTALQMIPATFYCLLNGCLTWMYLS